MADLADLFPGFESHWIDTSLGKIFARSGGKGPPLLLIHGYPESNVMWHHVAPRLAEKFTLVIPDLPGYGWSAAPESNLTAAKTDEERLRSPYVKRNMAKALVDVMEALGHVRFNVAGHDRGGRVAYRLALDHPGRVEKLTTLDIITTWDMWDQMDARLSMRAWHWMFLSQNAPLPELLLGTSANAYFDMLANAWRGGAHSGGAAAGAATPGGNKTGGMDERAIAHYRAAFTDPTRIHAGCEDYRAGATIDRTLDDADRKAGKKITCPMLVLWGARGLPGQNDPLKLWSAWATDLRGFELPCGHFIPEEAPDATVKALLDFFGG
jgi:haloacetate dehalogenase